MNKIIQKYICVCFLSSIPFFSCKQNNKLKEYSINGFSMGTSYHITYLLSQEHNYQYEVDSILSEINNSLSTYLPNSTISSVNQADSIAKIDTHFLKVYLKAVDIYNKTKGAFNPTIMPLVNAWGFGFENRANVNNAMIDSLKKYMQMEGLILDTIKHIITKTNPQIMLDFSAIAKGYGVDVISEFFSSKAIENHLVEIGGEIRTKGKNSNGEWWTIGIDKPIEDTTGISAIIKLENSSIATSGNYRNFYILDGKHYAHIIDPTTGYPVTHHLLSVSVFAKDCMTADAFATACMVLGVEKSMLLAENNPEIELFLLFSDEQKKLKPKATDKIKNKIELSEDFK